jgi:hypothetical protein
MYYHSKNCKNGFHHPSKPVTDNPVRFLEVFKEQLKLDKSLYIIAYGYFHNPWFCQLFKKPSLYIGIFGLFANRVNILLLI